MNILAFCINPLFPDRIMGGATKHLQNVAVHLGRLGHHVTVLCTQRSADHLPFRWHDNVEVRPLLRFKQPFPQPYDTPAYNLANAIRDVADHLQTADRFYMHDGEFLFPYVYRRVPTVVSLRDNIYPETMLGGFLFQGDALIAISDYSRDFYLNTIGRFFPDLAARLVVIPNGIDWDVFRPTPPREILQIVPVDPQRDLLVLHPHRPEPAKGLLQSIAVVDRLVHQYGLTQVKALVPNWLEGAMSAETQAFYDAVQQQIARRGLGGHVLFHDWIPQRLMPEYYSLGAVTLSLGHFVESFGNAVYESLGCGTPAIAARVSTHRTLLPDEMLPKVHYGDTETAASLAAAIITQKTRTPPHTTAALRQRFDVTRQLDAYADVILNAQLRPPPTYVYRPLTAQTRYRLAPWCYLHAGSVYHDFLATHEQIAPLAALAGRYAQGFTPAEAAEMGITAVMLETWRRAGYLTA